MPDLLFYNPGFEEPALAYVSASQSARAFTEAWAAVHLFCPHCGAERVSRYPDNRPVADFHCAARARDSS